MGPRQDDLENPAQGYWITGGGEGGGDRDSGIYSFCRGGATPGPALKA